MVITDGDIMHTVITDGNNMITVITNPYIIFSPVLRLHIVLHDCDVLVPVRPHLGVHHSEYVHHLVQQTSLRLLPAFHLVGYLVVAV